VGNGRSESPSPPVDETGAVDAIGGDLGSTGRLLDAIVRVASTAQIMGIGLGASRPIDQDGTIRNPFTLASYSDVAIADWIPKPGSPMCRRQ
jgi:hypothetical protein